MKKKLLSVLLATVLLLTCIPLGALGVSAAESGTTGDCTWTFNNGKLTITGSGKMADYGSIWEDNYHPWPFEEVKSVTIGKGVTKIGNNAFYMCTSLTSVVIPDSVTELGKGAFEWCDGLLTATIGKGVKTITESAFGGCCSLKDVTIGQNVTSIGDSAFGCCCKNLSSIVIPDGVTKIGKSAFADCDKLTSITIGKNIKTLDVGAFSWYTKPSKIHVYYKGSKVDRKTINFSKSNVDFQNATWHYNYFVPCKTHSYKKTVTKATATTNGSIKYVCTECKYVASQTTTINKASKVSLSKTTYTYSGKVVKPSVTVKDSKGNTISKSNYTVTYASGRKNVGTYKVTIKFKGNYSGTKTLTFNVIPRAASINKLTVKSKAIDVKLNRNLKQSTGYQIQYSTSASFKTYKTKGISDYTKTGTTLSGLKAKTTYYVRVRTYKLVNGKKVYSNWSTAKKIKTK